MMLEEPKPAGDRIEQASDLLAGACRRARTEPDSPAAVTADACLTWAGLFNCARSADASLAALDPGVVLIDCGRRPAAVAAIVACVQAKRPFLLLDESVPPARRAAMAADCSAAGVLRPDDHGGLLLEPGRPGDGVGAGGEVAGVPALYWIYTSGSTGGPKGTAIPVTAVAELLPALAQAVPELSAASCLGVTASFGFDPALQQIFAGLYLGATIALPSEHVRRSPEALLAFWATHHVDIADGTPLLLRALARTPGQPAPGQATRPLPVRCLLIGGDVLRSEDVRALWHRFGAEVAVYNFYGVAECAVDSVVGRVSKEQTSRPGILPAGRELRHSVVLLLDEQQRPVPDGSPGEIWIGGPGVGLGYPARPDETARALRDIPGHGICYRTGDQGHRLGTGELVLTGRLDRQLKVAGRRVEPAEVEAALAEWITASSPHPSRVLRPAPDVRRCSRCVLSENYPGSDIDENSGLCRYCRMPEQQVMSGWGYFRDTGALDAVIEQARATTPGEYDALLLFSGGKDSSYVLYRLLEMKLRIAAFTFDNGFISDDALSNIERMCSQHDVPHRYGSPADSSRLLAESLRLDDTVCSGCFAGITATGSAVAAELGCRFVISGLSRGQIIDTKLLQFVRRGHTDLRDIDGELHQHRRLYLQRRSAFSAAVGAASAHASIAPALDFFRYEAPGAERIQEYLASHDPRWQVPQDTGVCSTNCRANDAGIAEHLTRRKYHNYESPLSWEVRLGTLSRPDALARVAKGADAGNVSYVHSRLARGVEVAVVADDQNRLVGYVAGHLPASPEEVKAGLADWLPWYMIPARIEVLPDGLPRLSHNKIDYVTLTGLASTDPNQPGPEPPQKTGSVADGDLADQIRAAWSDVLGQTPTAGSENFFHLGGDSLAATELSLRLTARLGVSVPIITIHEAPVFVAYTGAVREWLDATARRPADPPSALGVRIQEITKDIPDGQAVTVFLMPDAAGLAVSLPRLFASAARDLPVNLLAVGYSAQTWPDQVSLTELASEIAQSITSRVNGDPVVLAGWSFGAVLADHTATALAELLPRVSAAGGSGGASPRASTVECWLLDPPPTSKADALALKDQIKERLVDAFPQLSPPLRRRGDWASILEVIDRASHYRDGPRRVLAAQPDFVRWSLAVDVPEHGDWEPPQSMLPQLRTVLRTLAMLGAENIRPPAAGAAQVTIRRFRPELSTIVVSTADESISGVDHWSMIEPERYAPYAERLAKLCAKEIPDARSSLLPGGSRG